MQPSPAQIDDVLKRARAALKAHPREPSLHNVVAPIYEQTGRWAEALPHLSFLHSLSPDEALTVRYARALERAGSFLKAKEILRQGLERFPDSALLLKNRALAASLLGDFPDAVAAYGEILRHNPADHHSRAMLGYLRLLISGMREGYGDYAFRPIDEKLAALFTPWPRWAGEPVAGKKLALWSEQGIGDVIMFMGLVPWLVQQGAKVTLVINKRLKPLAVRSFAGVEVVSEDGLKSLTGFDYHLPLGDLLNPALGYNPADHAPYLQAEEKNLREKYLSYAKERGREKLVGIAWHTTNPEVGFTRNIALSELKPLFSLPGIQFVSLQYGDHAEEISVINKQFKDILFCDPGIDAMNDLDGLASQMKALDRVVTIDNMAVHLAGALGVPATLLLSPMPDWRWGLSGEASRWYGSVELFRQEKMLNWQPVIKRLRERLQQE